MIENDIKRNGSGYYDETPVKSGVFNGPQPGEIWESTKGKEFLILKNHGGVCQVVACMEYVGHPGCIEIISRSAKYVNPVLVSYQTTNNFRQFVKAVPDDQFLAIMEAVGEKLGVTIKVSKCDNTEGPDERDKYIERLEIAVVGFEGRMKDAQRELEEYKQNAPHADVATAVKAEMYESLYKDLLKECLARGEAK